MSAPGGGPRPDHPDHVDRPEAVRTGETLDAERIGAFLREAVPGLEGTPAIAQFPAGFSNLTYLLTFGDRELVLRRPPFGTKPKSGHDMRREHTVLSAIRHAFPYAPRPLVFCDDEAVLDCPFLVMERVRGIVLRRDLPPGLELSADQMRTLCERLVDVHVELHGLDFRALGLAGFGRPEGYVERQVRGWSDRYRRARTDDVPAYDEVIAWLAERMPGDDGPASLIHNDYKLDNLVLDANDPLRIVGVLDWEMATLGDPRMDLGASLAYWVERDDPPELQAGRMMPTDRPGALRRAEIVARYAERSGLDLGGFDFFYVFGLFRLAAIAQQIYYRFARGQTRDRRFARLRHAVIGLERAALSAIERRTDAGC